MSNNQEPIEDPQAQEQEEKIEMKKSTKRDKSRGKRSKSKKSKTSTIDRELDENINKETGDEYFVDGKVEGMDEQRGKKGVLTSTTVSTKKELSQQQEKQDREKRDGILNEQQLNHNNHTKPSSERQVKLNYFLKKGELTLTSHNNKSTTTNNNNNINSLSLTNNNPNTSSLTTNKYAITEFERKQSSLEKRLKEKEAILERMKLDKEIHMQRFNRLKIESEEYKLRCRETMEKQLKEYGKIRREEKGEINPKYGYYKQAGWTIFVEGEIIVNNKRKLKELTEMIEELEEKKRTCTINQRESITAQIDHLTKQLNEHKEEMKKEEHFVAQYKERLRLSEKEQSSTIARQNWNVIENRYLPIEMLGCGGFGEVYKAYDLDTSTHVAIKINCFEPIKNQEQKEEFFKHVHREVATLKELNHPNIAKLVDEIIIDNKMSFVLEYCSGPELSKYLAKNEFLTEYEARRIIKQVSFALRYMYNQRHRVIHYDLKPANIIFHHGCVKILDFGLCKKMETEDTKIDLTSQGVGTYWYLPPETFMDGAEISSKVDVWSLGVIFYELLYGRRPFGHGIGQNKIYQDGIILKAIKVEFPTDKKFKVSEDAKNFIRECLKYEANERLDPEEVYCHEYLRN